MHLVPPNWAIALVAVFVSACAMGEKSNSLGDLETSMDAGNQSADSECQGVPDRTPCGSAESSACDRPDTCLAGHCVSNLVAAGTSCGDPGNTSCTAPDACDGTGRCAPNHMPEGTPCGSSEASACSRPDSCDGSGTCLENHFAAGTPCGSAVAGDCTAPDTCGDDGECLVNDTTDGTSCTDCSDGPEWCAICEAGGCLNLCTEAGPLTTTFAGGNGLNGNMFDISAVTDLRITGLEINVPVQPAGAAPHTIRIYYRTGSYVGHEQDPDAWTPLGQATVTSNGEGAGSPVPLDLELFVAAGQRVGLYVTTTGTAMRYSDGTQVGITAAADANLFVYEGSGNVHNFGSFFAPRVFNGSVLYKQCEP